MDSSVYANAICNALCKDWGLHEPLYTYQTLMRVVRQRIYQCSNLKFSSELFHEALEKLIKSQEIASLSKNDSTGEHVYITSEYFNHLVAVKILGGLK
jgi:hypothetical protein